MSTALAIASVTYVLRDLLNNEIIGEEIPNKTGAEVTVTTLSPDRAEIQYPTSSYLNLYMYRVTFNQGWRNSAYPSFDSDGNRVSNPPLGLDLHYLLTANGIKELHSEILLGHGMKLFHEMPVINRDKIRESLTDASAEKAASLPEELKTLSTSGLADQIGQIKIVPETLNTEEISKLWAAFGSKYRPSAAYQVSVVLIESTKSVKSALKVKQRNIYVNPFRLPVIEKVRSQKNNAAAIVEGQPILAGYNLVLDGYHFRNELVSVKTGDLETILDPLKIADARIIVTLPGGLKSGIQSIQVIHKKLMGSPPVSHYGVESNMAAFVLSSEIIVDSEYISVDKKIKVKVNPVI